MVTNDIAIQNIKLTYHIEVVTTDIQIKPKLIHFESLAEEEKKQQVLTLNNNTKDKALCEWLVPPFCISGITIMPKVFEIEPESVLTCILQYESGFRPYDVNSMEEIEKELIANGGKNLINVNNEDEENFTLPKGFNPLLEEKVKKEIESALTAAEGGGGKDGKKGKEKKKEDEKKKPEPKKDKKQLEEEEKKKKEEEERRLQEIEEARLKKLSEFNREKELKLFAADIKNFDANDYNCASQHSKLTVPLYYKRLKNNETAIDNIGKYNKCNTLHPLS